MAARIRSWLALTATALFVSILAGCTTCDSSLKPWLTISVVDRDTDRFICDATVLIEDGDFSEVVTTSQSQVCGYEGPEERAGSYTITVTHPDYETVTTEVDVEGESAFGGCLETEELRIELTPS